MVPSIQVDVIPAERPGLLGADARGQREDHVGMQPVPVSCFQQRSGLAEVQSS